MEVLDFTMKLLLLIAVLAALTMASPVGKRKEEDYSWENFKIKYNRQYSGEEEVKRKAIFDANVEKIKAHNIKYDNKEVTYLMGINRFADQTPEEFSILLGMKPDNTNKGAYTAV